MRLPALPTNNCKRQAGDCGDHEPAEVDKFQTAYQKSFTVGGFYSAAFSTEQKMSKESFDAWFNISAAVIAGK
jgi:hypothetical protein